MNSDDDDQWRQQWNMIIPSAGTGPQFTQLHVTQMKRKTKMKTTVEKWIESAIQTHPKRALTVTTSTTAAVRLPLVR